MSEKDKIISNLQETNKLLQKEIKIQDELNLVKLDVLKSENDELRMKISELENNLEQLKSEKDLNKKMYESNEKDYLFDIKKRIKTEEELKKRIEILESKNRTSCNIM